MTGTYQGIIPNGLTVDQKYITFCCGLNCSALDVVDLSVDAASSTIRAFVVSDIVQCVDVITNDDIAGDITVASGCYCCYSFSLPIFSELKDKVVVNC